MKKLFTLSFLFVSLNFAKAQSCVFSVAASGLTTFCASESVALSTPVQNTCSQTSNFGGVAREEAVGFGIGNKAYVGAEKNSGSEYKNMWKYDPGTNSRVRKANLVDAAIASANAIGKSSTEDGAYGNIGVNNVISSTISNSAFSSPSLFEMAFVDMVYQSSTSTQSANSTFLLGSTNQLVIGIQIVTSGTTSPLEATSFTFNTNGSNNAVVDISNATVYYTGNTSTFSAINPFGSFASPNGSFVINGNQTLATGTNYFWLTYDIASTATTNNSVDAQCNSLTVVSAFTPTVQAPAGNAIIKGALNGTYNIGASQSPKHYKLLTNALNDLNTYGVSGSVTFQLMADYAGGVGENFPLEITQYPGISAVNFLTIKPNAGVAAIISGASSTQIININGGDFVNIDGVNSGGSSLTIANTTTGSTATIQFINDATSDTIQRCTIKGAQPGGSSGVIFIATTSATTGNDNNTIKNCIIRNGASKPTNGIYAAGTSGKTNNDIIIQDNEIFNFYHFGVNISSQGNGDNWKIAGNSFYNTDTATTDQTAINLVSNSSNYNTISGNYIGGKAALATGTAWINSSTSRMQGIVVNVGTTGTSTIDGNTIANIKMTGNAFFFKGIVAQGQVTVGKTTGNTIGSKSVAASIQLMGAITTELIGITIAGASTGDTISNNYVGNISVSDEVSFTGISIAVASAIATEVQSNVVESILMTSTAGASFTGFSYLGGDINSYGNRVGSFSSPDNIQLSGTSGMKGIYISSLDSITITKDTVANMTCFNSTNGPANVVRGIYHAGNMIAITSSIIKELSSYSTTVGSLPPSIIGIDMSGQGMSHIVRANSIRALHGRSASYVSTEVTGIYVQFDSNGGIIDRNEIYGLTNNSAGATIHGIDVYDAADSPGWIVSNNMISISNSPETNGVLIKGIRYDEAGTGIGNFLFNTIVISGSSVGGNSYCLCKSIYNSAINIKGNILFNIRTGAGNHFAIGDLGSGWLPGASDTNNLYTINPNTLGEWGSGNLRTFSTWKNAQSGSTPGSGGDAGSKNVKTSFFDVLSNLHLNSYTNSALNNSAKPRTEVIADFDNETGNRTTTPDFGADEFTYVVPTCSTGIVKTSCPGTSSGSASVILSAGPSNSYTYLWTGGATTATINNKPVGTYTVTVTDTMGVFVCISQAVITNGDVTGPSITCPNNVTVNADAGICTASGVALGIATVSDNCTGVGTPSKNSLVIYPLGNTTVTWTVADASGNTNKCFQTVTVVDNQNPVISCNATINANTNFNSCSATINLTAPPATDNCGVVSVVSSHPSTSYPNGTTSVTWTATDNQGNTSACNQDVVVTDNENPFISCNAPVIANADLNSCSATISLSEPFASDNCSIASVLSDHPSTSYQTGLTVVKWTATDLNGNTAYCNQTVVVFDTQIPVISCPQNITIDANNIGCTATGIILNDPATSGNCSILSGSLSNDAPVTYPFGNSTVIWTVYDINGNSNSCSQQVTVVGNLSVTTTGSNAPCSPSNKGTASATPSNGSGTYFYLWSNGKTTATISSLATGYYTVTVTDSYGCSITSSVFVPKALTLTSSVTKINCGGKSSGNATVYPDGGVEPYSYLWNPGGMTTQVITGQTAGTYIVSVTDAHGCSKSKSVTISQNPPLGLVATKTGTNQATAVASGGIPAYTYLWYTTPNQPTPTATGLVKNHTYKVKVTDSKNCTKTTMFTMPAAKMVQEETENSISVFPNPTTGFVRIENVSCNNCRIKISLIDITGREIYKSDENVETGFVEKDFSNLSTGIYYLQIEAGDKQSAFKLLKN